MRYTLLLGAYFEYSITGGLDRCDTPCYWALTIHSFIFVPFIIRKKVDSVK